MLDPFETNTLLEKLHPQFVDLEITMNTEIYLDGNATSAVLPSAMSAAMRAMNELFGNPSSTHATGLKAKAMMVGVRRIAERLLGVAGGRLMFNSGATEGIQTAILSALLALRERRDAGETIGEWLVYGATEHKAVPESLRHWNRVLGLNLAVKTLPVNQDGLHDLEQLRTLASNAGLVCTMAANNETGVISDLDGIQAVLAAGGHKAYWLVDCVQALGKLQLNLAATRIDYAPFSGHKLYAPKGIGMLYVREGAPFTPLMIGGGQESGQRSGTENMAGIAALGEVLRAIDDGDTFRRYEELCAFRERLAGSLRSALPGVVFNAPFGNSLPTTLNFSVPWLSSKALLDLFDAANIRVSSGSACSAAKSAPSYVLEAMGLPAWRSGAAIRLSFGPLTSAIEISAACARIAHCGQALHAGCMSPTSRSDLAVSQRNNGPIQFSVDGLNTWLVVDGASRSCVIIDPRELLGPQIENYIRCHGYGVRAVLHTDRAGLAGTPLVPLVLGQHAIVADAHGADDVIYLLTETSGTQEVARFAFIGRVAPTAIDSDLVGTGTILCPGHDRQHQICTTVRAGLQPPYASMPDSIEADHLVQFMHDHPTALLVDVRERYEQAAGQSAASAAPKVVGVPLSELTGHMETWLTTPQQPLVFFCRSGNRSARAADCLRRLGHDAAWTLNGGMASAASILQLREQNA